MDCGVVSAGDMAENPLKVVPSSVSVPLPVALKPTAFSENAIENQAASMANRSCSPPLLSPAEASPAKPATTMPTLTNGVLDTSPTTMDIASASDSLASAEMSQVIKAEIAPSAPSPPPQCTGSENTEAPVAVSENKLSASLSFKGICVTLDNDRIWKEFYGCGTEMIVTKAGRRMFPCCRYRLSGLEPTRHYSLVLSISPVDPHRHRFNGTKWEVGQQVESLNNGLIRAFAHHNSPGTGAQWMSGLVSFHKLKLTNSTSDVDAGHIVLHSMQHYIPRLHVIPVPDGAGPTVDQPVIKGPESLTFTFPQTEFYSVTTYQNLRITQLKISHNPFAKGFREAMQSFGLSKPTPEALPMGRDDNQSLDLATFRAHMKHAGSTSFFGEEEEEEEEDDEPEVEEAETQAKKKRLADESDDVEVVDGGDDAAGLQDLRAQLASVPQQLSPDPPLTSTPSTPPFPLEPVQCGEPLPLEVPKRRYSKIAPKLPQPEPTSTPELSPESPKRPRRRRPTSTPEWSPESPKRPKRRRRYRRWGATTYQGGGWGKARFGGAKPAAAAAAAAAASQPRAYAMQPELDDVEGLLFVSFTSKEALGVHVGSMSTSSSLPVSPVSFTPQRTGSDQDKISPLQEALEQDLRVLKHRQVIHPVLQEVGLKLSSLDPTQVIDLQYLGVRLPLPPPVLPEQPCTTVPMDIAGGLSFVSRTGKTSDLTKIKGWRDKFVKRNDSSALKRDRSQKDLSAFCSNMLDEYLESEANQISERAAAFSTNSEVSYRLPSSSASYVKTLDSVLRKHQNSTPKVLPRAIRPCPLSFKPLLYSALVSPVASVPDVMGKTKHRPIAPKPTWVKPTWVVKPTLVVPETHNTEAQKSKRVRRPNNIEEASTSSQSCPPGTIQKAVEDRSPPASSLKPAQSVWQSAGYIQGPAPFRPLKSQIKIMEMETGALNQGLRRTHLTPQRVSIALSVMLTAQMDIYQKNTVPQYQKPSGPECGQEFCRLGCVCSSLKRESRGPLHCRRPDCMFGCACFKRKIIKLSEDEEQDENLYTVSKIDAQPTPGSHSEVLWDQRSAEEDPEPIFCPKRVIDPPRRPMPGKKAYVPRILDPVREEDKDPVYKYFERMMTCARVREFTNKPPAEPTPPQSPMFNTPACPQPPISPPPPNNVPSLPTANVTIENVPTKNVPAKIVPAKIVPAKIVPPTVLKVKTTVSGGARPVPKDPTKGPPKIKRLLEVQSKCQWSADRQLVLRDLCSRMTQNNFPPEFSIGPYRIRLMDKITKRNHSWTTMTYKVRISKPKKKVKPVEVLRGPVQVLAEPGEVEGEAEPEEAESEEWEWDNVSDDSSDEELEPVEEEMPPGKPEIRVGVAPFLSGVLPAGHLRARKKRAGKEPVGLVKVNNKGYNQARLLLGVMGSLHPANRLAAYVTGRLQTATKPPSKNKSRKHESDLSKKATVVGQKPQSDRGKKPAVCPKPQSYPSVKPAVCPKTPASLAGLSQFVKLTGQVAPRPPGQAGPRPPGQAGPRPPGQLAPRPPGQLAPRPPGQVAPRPPGQVAPRPPGQVAPRPPGQVAPRPPGQVAPRPPGQVAPRPLQQAVIRPKLQRGPRGPYKVNRPTPTPMVTFVSNRHGAVMPSGNNASSSPISLTVSPSLKSPSFLGQSGTYSFRICPPPADQSQTSPTQGVTLPGGFTLIQLPKPGDAQGTQQQTTANAKVIVAAQHHQQLKQRVVVIATQSASTPQVDKAGLVQDRVCIQTKGIANIRSGEAGSSLRLVPDRVCIQTKGIANIRSGEAGSSPQLNCEEAMPSDESDEAEKNKSNEAMKEIDNTESQRDKWNRRVKMEPTIETDNCNRGVKREPDEASEDLSSNSSDGDYDDDSSIDIETVEDSEDIVAEMRAAARRILSRESSEDSGSSNGQRNKLPDDGEELHKRNCHNLIERRRRSEQRHLFSRLQTLLRSDPRVPKLHLLTQAQTEIHSLVETSKNLEENKRMLMEMQSIYVKELSRLSGKPEVLIKTKLKQICEKKKLLDAQRAERERAALELQQKPKPVPEPEYTFLPKLLPKPQSQPVVSIACPPGQVKPQTQRPLAPKSLPCRTLVLVPVPDGTKSNSGVKPSVSLSVSNLGLKPSVSLSGSNLGLKPNVSLSVSNSGVKPSVSLSGSNSGVKPSVSLSVSNSGVKPSVSLSGSNSGVNPSGSNSGVKPSVSLSGSNLGLKPSVSLSGSNLVVKPSVSLTVSNSGVKPSVSLSGSNSEVKPSVSNSEVKPSVSKSEFKPIVSLSVSNSEVKPSVSLRGYNSEVKPIYSLGVSNSEVKPSVSLSGSNSEVKPSVSLSGSNSEVKPSVSLSGSNSGVEPSVSISVSNSSSSPSESASQAAGKTVALPLMRSKAGRIILPSSLKPANEGYYTLMLMGLNKNAEEREKEREKLQVEERERARKAARDLALDAEKREKVLTASSNLVLNAEVRGKALNASSNSVPNADEQEKKTVHEKDLIGLSKLVPSELNSSDQEKTCSEEPSDRLEEEQNSDSTGPVEAENVVSNPQEKIFSSWGGRRTQNSDSTGQVEAQNSDSTGPLEAQNSDSTGPVEAQNSDSTGPVEAENVVSNPPEKTLSSWGVRKTGPLVEIARLNKSIFSSSVPLQPVDKMVNGGRLLVVSKVGQTTSLCLKSGSSPDVSQSATLKEQPEVYIDVDEAEPTTPEARRGRGRPRKLPLDAPIAVGGLQRPLIIRVIPNGETRFTKLPTAGFVRRPSRSTAEQTSSTTPGSTVEQPGSPVEPPGSEKPESTEDQPGSAEEQPGSIEEKLGSTEDSLEEVSEAPKSPVPVKRGPGRPRKRPRTDSPPRIVGSPGRGRGTPGRGRGTTTGRGRGTPGRGRGTPGRGRGTPVGKTASSPTMVARAEPSPTQSTCSENTPVSKPKDSPATVNPTRHMTRGALGKDFPSAKKRSWLDMEKALAEEKESHA